VKTDHPRIPVCTYRLQFNRWFTFAQARELIPYLRKLGVSDVYASPYFQASPESMHGYDITDHNQLNAAIGSREEYDAFTGELHAHGMGQVLDFVPNHMGVMQPGNKWWMDVLENGPSSMYAPYFDIDWHPLKSDLEDKVLLPILTDQYGRVLERGEFKVRFDEGAFYLEYRGQRLPIAPGTYRYVLDLALENLTESKDEPFYAEFQSILTALEYLPRRTEIDPEKIAERAREKEIVKRRLERRCQEAPQVQRAIENAIAEINGHPGDARSFDKLDQLLNAQSYRLAFWRVAAEEINYRRFFDVNDLAAIRMELPEVFDAAHELILDLIRTGAVTGLRIDHPDGLYLPREYLEKLQRRSSRALEATLPKDGRAIYLVVEKILTGAEKLHADWPAHGTTGYDFTNQVAGVLVDASAEAPITKAFHRFIGHTIHFGHLVYAKKRLVMRIALANEVEILGNMLDRLSEKNRWFRDFTFEALARAVRETIACFPVYRTYLAPGQPVSEEDRQVIERAIAAAKRRNPATEESIFNFLRDILLFRFPENLDAKGRDEHIEFVLKFQQFTGPIMAKGLEDTAFYIYNRLAALNEVGGEPQQFGISVGTFHQKNLERHRSWPATLLATSTHDTKRSEDVRARMIAISEMAETWRRVLPKWRAANRRWKKAVEEAGAPDGNEEYLLYQTLLGTWPLGNAGAPERNVGAEYIERIQNYMTKALNEAKLNTSWIQPNEQWLSATRDFVARILDPAPRNKFLPLFLPVAEQIARLGVINSLAQIVLKLTSPGVPDIYQGNEIWDFSLVDPDNRRPVDYKLRAEMLSCLSTRTPEQLLRNWTDGRIKMFVTQRALQFRGERPDLFRTGEYLPLHAKGTLADCVIAFARKLDGQSVIVIVPRLSVRVGFPPIGDRWKDTTIELPEGFPLERWRQVLTGHEFWIKDRAIRIADALSVLPVAILSN
jgi:(1->4)-alpha-D-glucan 1-alpha-D-glucosylmutase